MNVLLCTRPSNKVQLHTLHPKSWWSISNPTVVESYSLHKKAFPSHTRNYDYTNEKRQKKGITREDMLR